MAKKEEPKVTETAEKTETAVAPVAAAAQTAVTPAEQKEIEARWEKIVQDFSARKKGLSKDVLQYYWDLGDQFKDISDRPGYYGSHSVEELGERIDLSPESIRACFRFRRCYSKTQLESLQKKQVSWHSTAYLLAIEDVEKRTDLEDKLATGKIQPKQLMAEVKKIQNKQRAIGKKKEKRGGAGPKVGLRKGATICDKAAQILSEETQVALRSFAQADHEVQKTLTENRKELHTALKACKKSLEACLSFFD